MKKTFLINKNFVNTRFDKWFRLSVSNVPQSLIEKSIRKGNIKINGKKKKCSYKLQENDKIILYNINFSESQNIKSLKRYIPTKKDLLFSTNIFVENNENFAVINKPAGIAVQPGTKSRRNIIDILKKTKEFDDISPFVVHRIDKDTTGILIVAKNRKYAQLFTSLFRLRKIHKTYLGIVIGELEKNKGTFIDMLFYYEGKKEVKTKAITHFKVLDTNKNYTLLKLTPETGRKHQLRKQLLMHGHPILGDNKYRFTKRNLINKNELMLHAYKINFTIDSIRYNFSAELPLIFEKTLREKYLKIYLQ